MSRAVQVLEDGTRVYAGGARYRPVPAEERKIGMNKPDHPDARRFHGRWFLPLELLVEEARVMPETRPDELVLEHMETHLLCQCEVCLRPEAERWRRRWRREHGLSA